MAEITCPECGAAVNRPHTCDKCRADAKLLYVFGANGSTQTLCWNCLQDEIAKLKRRQPGPSETK